MAIQEIGIPVDLSKGTFANTEYKDGKLQLKAAYADDNGQIMYVPEGYWISETIKIADKVKAFEYIAKNISGSGTYVIYTQSSADGFSWSEWQELGSDASILSPKDYYAKIKIFIYAHSADATFVLEGFESPVDNPFLITNTGTLEFKKTYTDQMTKDSSWTNGGALFAGLVKKTAFKKVDSLQIKVGD